MENEGMDLEIIINPKAMDDGQAVIQLETAAGAAVKHFKGAHGVNVPRNRFLPVKSCSDLLLIKSDIYSLEHGQLVINPSRMFENTPVIKLGDHFKKVSESFPLLLGMPDFFFFRRSNSSRSGSRRFQRSLSWTI
jgi:UTP--glucose-1-phosphate uridylyltransferase